MKKLIFLAGLAIGFVIGSRAGRGPYESLERTARQVADDPEVQRRTAQAKQTASRVAQDTAGAVKDKAPGVASSVSEAVTGAAESAKDRLTSGSTEDPTTLDEEAQALAESTEGTATSGGDAEIGEDSPLSS